MRLTPEQRKMIMMGKSSSPDYRTAEEVLEITQAQLADQDYIDRRNALIPEAEMLADIGCKRGDKALWGRVFLQQMHFLAQREGLVWSPRWKR